MEFTSEYKEKSRDIIAMFAATFTQSEGAEAGQFIEELVTDMLTTLRADDMCVFSAVEEGAVLGSIVFTRMTYAKDPREVFILAPVAIATDWQGRGLGQRLIRHGLQVLQQRGVAVALTYGDIRFYRRVGFHPISEAEAQAPLPLQYPEGWLGQSLRGGAFVPLKGPSRCVGPLDDARHW